MPPRRTHLAGVAMSERDLQAAAEDMCRLLRLRFYHTRDSRGSEPGFPDLVICGRRVAYRELKSERGRLSGAQAGWLAALAGAGADAGVWRPADHTSGRIWAELRALVPP